MNLTYLAGKHLERFHYIVLFDIILSFILITGIISNIFFRDRLSSLTKEIERQRLLINDYSVESALFRSVVEMMEVFGENISIEETLERITAGISSFFKNEIAIVQLFGERFFQSIKGENLNLPHETFEEIVTRPYPVLINNLESFPRYKFLQERGITSFILVPLKGKKDIVSGVIGVFVIFTDCIGGL